MKTIVGIADMKLSQDPASILITYTLGSCIGVTLYDPLAKVGGILHFMLPESRVDPPKAKINPWIFADTGIPLFFQEAHHLGGEKGRLFIKVVGGAQVLGDSGYFNVGSRNYLALRRILWIHELLISSEAVGGNVNRGVHLEVATGKVWVKTAGSGEIEL